MAGSIDNVYFCIFVKNRGVFGINGNAALLFEFVGVHAHVSGNHARLAQNGVREGRLAVVDVRDDCDVSYFHFVFQIKMRRGAFGAYL